MTDAMKASIRAFLDVVKNRISAAHVADAKDWLDHGEWGLSVEAIADGLFAANADLNAEERRTFGEILRPMGYTPSDFDFLKLDF